jgi:hypothetical protein
MYTFPNLAKQSGISPGSGAPKGDTIIMIVEDIAVFPPSDPNGVKMIGNFLMKSGKYPITVYGTKSKTEAPYESDGDEDSINISQKYMMQHPGNGLAVKELTQNLLGKNVIILHRACQEDFYEVMGTPCAPLQLKPSKTDNNDGRFHTFNFEAFAKTSLVPKHYEGDVVLAHPFVVADISAVPININNGYNYKLPALSTSVPIEFDFTGMYQKQTITLIGQGGSDPATLDSGPSNLVTVVLLNGTTWTALENAVINFMVVNAGTTAYFIELSRS